MSILIKNMRMPKDGDVLMVRKDDDGKTYIKESHTWGYSAELIELPAQHGRLIDGDIAEVIVTDIKDEVGDFLDGILYAADWIASQPTIIEAEEVSE